MKFKVVSDNVFLAPILALHLFSFSAISGEVKSTYIKYNSSKKKKSNSIEINLDKKVFNKVIDKKFYGSHFSNFAPVPGEKLVRDLGIGRIRVGGNGHDVYNWENSMTYVHNHGYSKIASFSSLKKLFNKYEAEEIFQVNILGYMPEIVDGEFKLALNLDEQHAANIIHQLNGKEKLNVKNLCLGNEFAQWHETHSYALNTEIAISADEYIERFIRYAVAIKHAQFEVSGNANDIKIWGPEMSASFLDWQTGNMEKDCEWTDTWGVIDCAYGSNKEHDHFIPYFLEQISIAENDPIRNPNKYKLLDFFTIHYYPNYRTDIDKIDSIIKDGNDMQMVNEILESTQLLFNPEYENSIDISSYRDFNPNILGRMQKWKNEFYPEVKFALTEFAVDSDDRTFGYHPMIRPLYMSDLIGILATNGVDFFNRFMLNSFSPDVVPWSLIEDESKTDLYKMYALFTKHYVGNVLEVKDDFGDTVNAYAVNHLKDNTITLIVVNKSVNDRKSSIKLKLDNGSVYKVLDLAIDGWSTTVVKIKKNIGKKHPKTKVLKFGAGQMSVYKDPYYLVK